MRISRTNRESAMKHFDCANSTLAKDGQTLTIDFDEKL